jgi:hypothetical protein
MEEFEKKLKTMIKPDVNEVQPPLALKLAILNAQRSATLGFWFIVIPCFFLACVIMKYYFHVGLGVIGIFEDAVATLDHGKYTFWMTPLLFVVLPLASIVLNALAIMHFAYQAKTKLLTISVKIKWLNVVLLLISFSIVGLFLLYGIIENANHL